jgi:lysophospholipase L1-like esterase
VLGSSADGRQRPRSDDKTLPAAVTVPQRPLRSRLGRAVSTAANAILRQTIGRPEFWQFQIRGYERADRASSPRPGVIVFTGSSSIRLWKTLKEDMKPLDVINRGFGGSQLAQVGGYARRIVTPYRPRAVVLYAGENDLSFGKSPGTVLKDFKQFVSIVRGDLPQTWIYYISIKPAPWGTWQLRAEANHLITEYARTQERLQFIDVSSAMLDSQGEPRRELYGWDPIHMNASGYALWTSIIKPALMERFSRTG